jgi:hypothetical protein
LRAIGVPLIAGRNFDNRDAVDAPRVVMINRKLAQAAFPHEDPVGKRVVFPWIKGQVEIVGVAGDENTGSLDQEVQPVVYFPYSQGLGGGWSTVVRTAGPATGLITAVRHEVRALDPEVVVFGARTMEQVIADAPYTVMRRYPATFAVVVAVLVGAALAASFIPAIRATRIPPVVAMGGE